MLVVEDDAAAAELLRAYLEPEGYRVRIADERFAAKAVEVELGGSAYLGTIMLEPRAGASARSAG